MRVELRGWRDGDGAVLAGLYRDSVLGLGSAAYDAAQVAAWARHAEDVEAFEQQLRGGELRVAEVDGAVAAFGLLEELDHVALLYCRGEFARRGLASAILRELEAVARAAGQVVLDTDASRVSRPFFERHGFHQSSREEVERDGVWLERFNLTKLLVEPEAKRWLILGNSASGKSTMARRIAAAIGGAALDLDTIAWRRDRPTPERREVAECAPEIRNFMQEHEAWVIEGCYEDLIEEAGGLGTVLVFLDPGVEVCLARAAGRGFEPHKFATPEDQAAALGFLQRWIEHYPVRDGAMSRAAHEAVFLRHPGPRFRCG